MKSDNQNNVFISFLTLFSPFNVMFPFPTPLTVLSIYLYTYILVMATIVSIENRSCALYKIGVRVAWIGHFLVCVGRNVRLSQAKEEPESHLVGQRITSTTTKRISTSTIVICSPGSLIEKTIKPNHQQQEIIEDFRLVT